MRFDSYMSNVPLYMYIFISEGLDRPNEESLIYCLLRLEHGAKNFIFLVYINPSEICVRNLLLYPLNGSTHWDSLGFRVFPMTLQPGTKWHLWVWIHYCVRAFILHCLPSLNILLMIMICTLKKMSFIKIKFVPADTKVYFS